MKRESSPAVRVFLALAGSFCVALATGGLRAENRLFIEDQDVAAGGQGRRVTIFADNDLKVLGFSVGINYNQRALSVSEVIADGTLAETADFFSGTIDLEGGLLGYGCIFSFTGREAKVLQPGSRHPI